MYAPNAQILNSNISFGWNILWNPFWAWWPLSQISFTISLNNSARPYGLTLIVFFENIYFLGFSVWILYFSNCTVFLGISFSSLQCGYFLILVLSFSFLSYLSPHTSSFYSSGQHCFYSLDDSITLRWLYTSDWLLLSFWNPELQTWLHILIFNLTVAMDIVIKEALWEFKLNIT